MQTAANERHLTGWDFFLLWAGAGIALTEIWAGGLLMPLGLVAGLLAILFGHVIGNLPMALAGLIGSRHGVPAIISTRGALGVRGSHLPAALNIVQLLGWTGVMLWIGGQAAHRLFPASPLGATGWIVLGGALTTLWAYGGQRLWRPLQRIAVALLLLLSVLMTGLILRTHGWEKLLAAPRAPEAGFMLGLDLVIAMPISWLPLVADYARHARASRPAFWGTYAGYLLSGTWMYGVGLMAALATGSDRPDDMVLDLLSGAGLAGAALLIVLLSTFTTTFLDIYSQAVSVQSVWPRLRERPLILVGGALGTLLACFFPAHQYERFLLLIGSAFCPLFGIVLADYLVLKRARYDADRLHGHGPYWYAGGVNPAGVGAWLAGFLIYQACSRWHLPLGSSLPGMLAPALIYLAAMKWVQRESAGAPTPNGTTT